MTQEKKTIALYPFHHKRHSVYNSTIDFLSKQYTLLYNPVQNKQSEWFVKLSRSPRARAFYHKMIRPLFSLRDARTILSKEEDAGGEYDLIFSANEIPPGEKPYVIEVENVISLSENDYYRLDKEKIRKEFSKERCKAIICWNDIAYQSLVKTIDCSSFIRKIYIIPFAIRSTPVQKNFSKKEVRLLFVSSINNPRDFEQKGGIIALEVYARLVKKYDNLRFIIRAHIPDWIQRKYEYLQGLIFQRKFLSQDAMNKLFIESDLLLEPIPGIQLLLECMNFAVPAVVFDFWMIPEMVIDGKNGYTVDCSSLLGSQKNMADYLRNHHLRYLQLYKKTFDEAIISEYALEIENLIVDPLLRKRMSKATKSLVNALGKYSLEKRNIHLLEVFNGALNST
ncbi:MAG: glycosyltransferase [Nanoarchaeota archaeon]